MAAPVSKSKAVVLMGGPKDGTRFRPLSLHCPKPLFPVAGAPMILHQLRACAEVPGLMEVVLIGAYDEHSIREFASRATAELKIPVRYCREHKSLGTAGGMYHLRDILQRGDPDFFFVLHCDVCADFPLKEMLEFHRGLGPSAVVTIMSIKAREDQAHAFGCAVSDEKTAMVLHYVEKPKSFVSSDINGGVYVMSGSVFDVIRKVYLRNVDNGVEEPLEMYLEKDIVPELISSNGLYLYKSSAFWTQVKTAGSAVYANRHYLAVLRAKNAHLLAANEEGGPKIVGDVLIDPSAVVHPSVKLGPNVSVGPGVRIQAGARVKDSILLSNAQLARHSCVLNAVIGWDSAIGEWTRVEGKEIVVNKNDPITHEATRPLFNEKGQLEPGITIVGEGVSIASGLVVLNSIVLPHKDISSNVANEILL